MNDAIPFAMRVEVCAEILRVNPGELRAALDNGARDRLLDYQEAAELLGISVPSLRSRVHRNAIPYIRRGARTVRFSERAIRQAAGQT